MRSWSIRRNTQPEGDPESGQAHLGKRHHRPSRAVPSSHAANYCQVTRRRLSPVSPLGMTRGALETFWGTCVREVVTAPGGPVHHRPIDVGAVVAGTAEVLAVVGVLAYNWWVAVPFVPGFMPSVNGFFSDLEVAGGHTQR